MNVSTGVALAVTLSGPAVAALAIIVGRLNSRDERKNLHLLARGNRRFEARSQVYEELLRYMLAALDHANEVEQSYAKDPRAIPSENPKLAEDERRVQVRSGIFGSPEVTEAALRFVAAINGFLYQARLSATATAQRRGDEATESARKIFKHRDEASDLLIEVQTMMREELEGL